MAWAWNVVGIRAGMLTRAGKVPGMEGVGAPAEGGATGHLGDPRGYSGGRGKRRDGPAWAAQGNVRDGMSTFQDGVLLLRSSAVVPGARAVRPLRCQSGVN